VHPWLDLLNQEIPIYLGSNPNPENSVLSINDSRHGHACLKQILKGIQNLKLKDMAEVEAYLTSGSKSSLLRNSLLSAYSENPFAEP
jgi:hypothetical protein